MRHLCEVESTVECFTAVALWVVNSRRRQRPASLHQHKGDWEFEKGMRWFAPGIQ